jgi:hypothetical protein
VEEVVDRSYGIVHPGHGLSLPYYVLASLQSANSMIAKDKYPERDKESNK